MGDDTNNQVAVNALIAGLESWKIFYHEKRLPNHRQHDDRQGSPSDPEILKPFKMVEKGKRLSFKSNEFLHVRITANRAAYCVANQATNLKDSKLIRIRTPKSREY